MALLDIPCFIPNHCSLSGQRTPRAGTCFSTPAYIPGDACSYPPPIGPWVTYLLGEAHDRTCFIAARRVLSPDDPPIAPESSTASIARRQARITSLRALANDGMVSHGEARRRRGRRWRLRITADLAWTCAFSALPTRRRPFDDARGIFADFDPERARSSAPLARLGQLASLWFC